jgi:hypothetical protein
MAASDYELIKTFYGKHSEIEVRKKKAGLVSAPEYLIFKDDEYERRYDDLSRAVEFAEELADEN